MSNDAICRVCTQNQPDTTPIFSSDTFSEQPLTISEVITTCASVQVHRDDGLPEQICTKCLNSLHQAYSFRKLCEKSDCELRNQICYNKEIKTEGVVWISEPKFVETEELSYEHNKLANVKLEIEEEDCVVNMYVEETKYEVERNAGNDVINTEEYKQASDLTEHKLPEESEQLSNGSNSKEVVYKCEVCDKTYSLKRSLARHIRLHTGENLFTCEYCDKQFTQNGYLQTHRKTHTGEKPFPCEICGKSFSMSGTLKVHKRVHTGETPYKCDVCSKGFKERTKLTKHLRLHNRTHECEECGKKFGDKKALREHKELHVQFKCDFCPEKFFRKFNLVEHVKKHNGEKPFKCDECGKDFMVRTTLTKHMKLHAREKQQFCNQ